VAIKCHKGTDEDTSIHQDDTHPIVEVVLQLSVLAVSLERKGAVNKPDKNKENVVKTPTKVAIPLIYDSKSISEQ